ncbi:hypothetical protein ZIOFF_029928 [Zingiber officinale]|uniref:COP1-interacting protein 7 n=1 Tax=Zingiber officinale TaxID=94328 RepID=A0A8J5GQB2_ZINOF|nr:hypothetical protein ZIOFF_029928 [Zingiber officinale]
MARMPVTLGQRRAEESDLMYEVLICKEGKFENLACGPLDQLAVHLAQVKQCQSNPSRNNFKLELANTFEISSWFTKSTLASFLGIVSSPDVVRTTTAVANEMSQLEDTRRFHLSIYDKKNPDHAGDATAGMYTYLVVIMPIKLKLRLWDVKWIQTKVEAGASDATKNELLRAIELRIVVLKEELVASFSQAAGATLSVKQLSDLAKFSQHFQNSAEIYKLKGLLNSSFICISFLFILLRDQTFNERSRPVVRSATPRRAASPMRRVQIGRSGSHRSTALTIKSLSYFSTREKIPTSKDTDENNSGDEQTDQPVKKSDKTVRRMSVQEAISLFENKQKDNNLDGQKRRASGDNSLINNKTVLRKWSSGLTDSLNHYQENASDPLSQRSCSLHVEEDNKMTPVKTESCISPGNLNTASETAQIAASPEVEIVAISKDGPVDSLSSEIGKIDDGDTASAEWSKQKEAELNQMLTKMERKLGNYSNPNTGSVSCDTTPSRRRSQPVCPTPPSPKIEKPLHQPRDKPEAKAEVKRIARGQGEKKQKTPANTNITVKNKNPTASPDESASSVAKPSFYDKVTKKGSVVPLEVKPARKFSRTGHVADRGLTKSRIIQSDASSKRSDNSIQVEEEQTPETMNKVLEADLAEQANDVHANLVTSLDNCLNLEKTETVDQNLADVDNANHNSIEPLVAEIQPDEDISISSVAWVELERDVPTACDTGLSNASISNVLEPPLISNFHENNSLINVVEIDVVCICLGKVRGLGSSWTRKFVAWEEVRGLVSSLTGKVVVWEEVRGQVSSWTGKFTTWKVHGLGTSLSGIFLERPSSYIARVKK